MSFIEQSLATFIGALVGFIFSIALFYLTEKWKKKRNDKDLGNNLQKELQYSINFLEEYKKDFDRLLRQIAVNDGINAFIFFRHGKLPRFFIQEAFSKGILYKYLNADEITGLNNLWTFFSIHNDQLSLEHLNNFKSEAINQQKASEFFEYQRGQIEKYIEVIKNLKDKLKKIK